jgi:hypothetical protein
MTQEPKPRKRRDLSSLSQLADIVASIAVLVTLVFLVAEVRQNTETARATSYAASMDGLTQWRLTMAGDPELAALWQAYNFGGASPEDFRLNLLVSTLWGIYENAYYSNQRGLMGESEWERFQRQICLNADRDLPMIGNLLTDEFRLHADTGCGG